MLTTTENTVIKNNTLMLDASAAVYGEETPKLEYKKLHKN